MMQRCGGRSDETVSGWDVLLFQVLQDLFQPTVFPDEFESRLRPYTFDGLEIVTAEENTEIDELSPQ